MSQEAASHPQGFTGAALQLVQEMVLVKLMEFLQVAKDAPPLAPEVLGHVCSLQLGEVVLSNITQSLHILPLCGQQLLHDFLQLPVTHRGNER